MTDLALILPGAAASGLAGDGSFVAPNTWPPANNNPAALKKPARMTSRRDIGMLKVMHSASAAGDGRLDWCAWLIMCLSFGWGWLVAIHEFGAVNQSPGDVHPVLPRLHPRLCLSRPSIL